MGCVVTLAEGERERIGRATTRLLNEITKVAQKHGKSETTKRILRDEFLINMISAMCTQVVEEHNKKREV